jgi:uncharacterized protein involved in exopolysaccharide biosynthesis
LDTNEDKQVQQYDDRRYVPEEDTISLLDLLGVLVKRRRLILFTTLFAAVFIVLFSIYTLKVPATSPANPMPNVYSPTVEVLIQDQGSSNSLSSILSGSGGSTLANLLGSSVSGATSTSSDLAQALLTENTILDQVVKDFNIIQKYHIEKYPLTSSRKLIKNNLKTKYDAKTGILSVSYTDTDPVFATKVVNEIVDLLQQRFRALTMEKVIKKKNFLGERAKEIASDLKKAENAIIAFQKKYGIVDLGAQTAQSAQQLASYQSQLYQLELQKQNLLLYNKPDSATVVRKQNEIDQLRKFINELEGGFRVYSAQTIPADQLVQLGVDYQNLQMNVTLQSTLYKTVREQFEASKIEELSPSQTLQIIEHAEVPELKSGPSRGIISIIVTISAFFLAVFTAFIMEYFDKAGQDPIEAQKLEAIRKVFRRNRS